MAMELNIKLACGLLFNPEVKNFTVDVSILLKVFALILETTPPPVKYLTVNVVFEGAVP